MATAYKYDLKNAIFTDVNPQYGVDSLPFLIPDEQGVCHSSLFALLNCPIGERGGLFEPGYGNYLAWFIHEPIDEITANKIRISLHTTFKEWEPRIDVLLNDIVVKPDYTLPGYILTVTMTYKLTKQQLTQSYILSV